MPLDIPVSHPTFLLENKVKEFCAPFFAEHKFNHFQYARLYADGSMGCLFSNAGPFRQFIDLDYPSLSSFKEDEHQGKQTYWFLWDEELPWLPVKMVRDCHNIHHGLTLLRRSKNYYDMIAVAMPEERLNAGSYYLSRLKAIEQFVQSFEQNNKDLLDAVMPNPLVLPEHTWDRNLHKILSQNSRFAVAGNTYVTGQELACLRLLLSGLTYKEIAAMLTLSSRSVETYIARAKQRTGRTTTPALRDMLSACP